MKPANEQWFLLYELTPGAPRVIVDPNTGVPTFAWSRGASWAPASDVEHVHHPDFYHPDPHVRVAHNRAMLRSGVAIAACGLEHDPRVRFVATDKPRNPCPACVAATKDAARSHDAFVVERKKIHAEAAKKRADEEAAFYAAIRRAAAGDPR